MAERTSLAIIASDRTSGKLLDVLDELRLGQRPRRGRALRGGVHPSRQAPAASRCSGSRRRDAHTGCQRTSPAPGEVQAQLNSAVRRGRQRAARGAAGGSNPHTHIRSNHVDLDN